eukprot:scaffold33922_cov34-Tisochrysis_lutea.AAC.3
MLDERDLPAPARRVEAARFRAHHEVDGQHRIVSARLASSARDEHGGTTHNLANHLASLSNSRNADADNRVLVLDRLQCRLAASALWKDAINTGARDRGHRQLLFLVDHKGFVGLELVGRQHFHLLVRARVEEECEWSSERLLASVAELDKDEFVLVGDEAVKEAHVREEEVDSTWSTDEVALPRRGPHGSALALLDSPLAQQDEPVVLPVAEGVANSGHLCKGEGAVAGRKHACEGEVFLQATSSRKTGRSRGEARETEKGGGGEGWPPRRCRNRKSREAWRPRCAASRTPPWALFSLFRPFLYRTFGFAERGAPDSSEGFSRAPPPRSLRGCSFLS